MVLYDNLSKDLGLGCLDMTQADFSHDIVPYTGCCLISLTKSGFEAIQETENCYDTQKTNMEFSKRA